MKSPDIFLQSLIKIGIISPQGLSEIWHRNTKKNSFKISQDQNNFTTSVKGNNAG